MDPPAATTKDEETTLPSSLRDPQKLFFQTDGIRRSVIGAYWAVFLLALPIWWYTTSIERLALPASRIHQVAENRLELPIRVCVDADQTFVKNVRNQISTRVIQEPDRWKGVLVDVRDNLSCGEVIQDVYTVVSTEGPITIKDRQLSFPLDKPDSVTELVKTLTSLLVPYSVSSDPEHRVAQYSPRYRLAFSLLNEDAAAGDAYIDWNILSGLRAHILPITRRLNALHNFTVESQLQFHAPLAFEPVKSANFYGITPEDLTVFINSAEWILSSSSSNDPILHFVLFIPSAERRPIRLLTHDGAPSTSFAFLLPQWGGIVIHNPVRGPLGNIELPLPVLHETFSLFANQLLALLGVPALPAGVANESQAGGLSAWQLDALIRRRTLENVQGSQDTLLSILKLVDQIENMPVGEDVRGDVDDALEALNEVYESSRLSLYQSFAHSAQSFRLSSRAFFNPGMLALLYFPPEHTYAVYSTLFAPTIMLVFIAALREIIAYRRQRKLARDSVAKPH